jgi:hypothetical protein
MARPPQNGLESALGNSMPRRFREFAVVPFDGEGAICVPMDIWQPAAAWAASRRPSGNRLRDRSLLLQRLDVLVTRRGTSMISTTGSHQKLGRLRNAMRAENIDLKEWNFPPDEILDQAAGTNRKPGKPENADEEPGASPEPGTESTAD